jgi:hypothetical protein
LGVDIEIEGKTITLINIYGPNNDTPLFYNKVSESIEYFNNHSTILTGDYNLVQRSIIIWAIYINKGVSLFGPYILIKEYHYLSHIY